MRKFWYKFWYKFSPAQSVINYVQLELDSSFKYDSVKLSVEQPGDDMLRLRKPCIKKPNKIMIADLNINSIRNKFEMLSLSFNGVIDILTISETKVDDSSPTEQFIIEGYSTIYRLDKNDRGRGIMLIVKGNLLTSRLDKYRFSNEIEMFCFELNFRKENG